MSTSGHQIVDEPGSHKSVHVFVVDEDGEPVTGQDVSARFSFAWGPDTVRHQYTDEKGHAEFSREHTAKPLHGPTASISSMKTMQGAFLLPCSNRSRTLDAPILTNISTKSDPLIEKNGTSASPATARANRVFPVPGGPMSSTPFGSRPPSFWNFWGSFKNSIIS